MSRPDWSKEGADWPNRALSRFVEVDGLVWHVQEAGDGEALALIHGTGAATHSWRALLPRLAQRFRVLAMDLPGHGFTAMPRDHRLSIDAMSARLAALFGALDFAPALVAGHSAGAALALRMTLDGRIAPRALVGFNAALLPFPGAAGHVFPWLAKAFFLNPFAAAAFAARARQPGAVARLIRSTGSTIDAFGLDCYARLFAAEKHVSAALGMMAAWDLHGLKADLPRLRTPTHLAAAEGDRAVPPDVAGEVSALTRAVKVTLWPALGHLAHEEDPELAEALIDEAAGG